MYLANASFTSGRLNDLMYWSIVSPGRSTWRDRASKYKLYTEWRCLNTKVTWKRNSSSSMPSVFSFSPTSDSSFRLTCVSLIDHVLQSIKEHRKRFSIAARYVVQIARQRRRRSKKAFYLTEVTLYQYHAISSSLLFLFSFSLFLCFSIFFFCVFLLRFLYLLNLLTGENFFFFTNALRCLIVLLVKLVHRSSITFHSVTWITRLFCKVFSNIFSSPSNTSHWPFNFLAPESAELKYFHYLWIVVKKTE